MVGMKREPIAPRIGVAGKFTSAATPDRALSMGAAGMSAPGTWPAADIPSSAPAPAVTLNARVVFAPPSEAG